MNNDLYTREELRREAIDALTNELVYYLASGTCWRDVRDDLQRVVTSFVDRHEVEFEEHYDRLGDYVADVVDDHDMLHRIISHAREAHDLTYLTHERPPLFVNGYEPGEPKESDESDK